MKQVRLLVYVMIVMMAAGSCHKVSEVSPEENSQGFVMLANSVPDAILEVRYFSTYNPVGQRIDGYLQPSAIITKQAADSLAMVQRELLKEGLRLKVYDAYRPKRAVNHIYAWALNEGDQLMKSYFYPTVKKSDLIGEGYITSESDHTRGSAVDVSLFDMAKNCDVDMGTVFDFLGVESSPTYCAPDFVYRPEGALTEEQFENRMRLRNAMERHGFVGSERYWWHFALKKEPYPDTYFVFPVEQLY